MTMNKFKTGNVRLFLLAFLTPTLFLGIPLFFGINFNGFFSTILAFMFPTLVLGIPLFLAYKKYQNETERRDKIETLTLAAGILEGLEESISDPAKDMRAIIEAADLEDLIRMNKAIEKIEIAIAKLRSSYNIVGEVYADAGLALPNANKGNNNNQNKGNNNQNNNNNNQNNNNNNQNKSN